MNKIMSLAFAVSISMIPAMAQDAPVGAPAVGGSDSGFTAGGGKQFGGERGRRGSRGGHMNGALQSVLTPEQKEQVKAIMQQSRADSKPLFEKMQAMRAKMQGGANMDDATKAEFASIRKQMKARHEDTQSKILALLSPEQKAKFEAAGGFQKHGRSMGEGGWGGGRRGGKGGFGGGKGGFGGGQGGFGGGQGGFGGGQQTVAPAAQ